jgi:hypothetical protein
MFGDSVITSNKLRVGFSSINRIPNVTERKWKAAVKQKNKAFYRKLI